MIAGNFNVSNTLAPVDELPVAEDIQLSDIAILPLSDKKFAGQTPPVNLRPVTDPLQFTITARENLTLIDLDPERPGLQTRVVLEIPEGIEADTYVKFAPTPDNPTPHFFEFLAPSQDIGKYEDGAVLIRNAQGKVVRVVITLTDGANGDFDLIENGKIIDPGYLALREAAPPAPIPAPMPEPSPTPLIPPRCNLDVDGLSVRIDQRQLLVVPIVTAARVDHPNSKALQWAEIPVAFDGDEVVLQVNLPEGIGFTAEELLPQKCDPYSLLGLIKALAKPWVESIAEFDEIVRDGIEAYATRVDSDTAVTVRTVIFKQDGMVPVAAPIHILGARDDDAAGNPLPRQQAVIIDAHQLAPGSTVQLDDIEFAIVLGNVQVTGGRGHALVIGDRYAQALDLGPGNDTLYGGSGDDQLNPGRGDNLVEGSAGCDTLIIDDSPLANLQLLLVKNTRSIEQPYDAVVVDVVSGSRTIVRGIEQAVVKGTLYNVDFLQRPASVLENLAIAWYLLAQPQEGLASYRGPSGEVLQNAMALAEEPRALLQQLLARDEIQARWQGLNDEQFAAQLLDHAFGTRDDALLRTVIDYLATHDRIDALLLALQHAAVRERAYGDGGLLLYGALHPTSVSVADNRPAVPALVGRDVITSDTLLSNLFEKRDGQYVEHRKIQSYLAPIVPQRIEDPKTLHEQLADVPIAINGAGDIVLQVGLPVGIGFKADELIATHYPLTLSQTLDAFLEHRIDDTPLSASMRLAIERFVTQQVTNSTQAVVRHIVFEQDPNVTTDQAIVITGALGKGEDNRHDPERQEIVIIDAQKLRPGSKFVIQHVELAIVFGEVTVQLGDGHTTLLSDQGNQVVLAGAGNASIDVGSGRNFIDGGTGVDTWLYDQPGAIGVYLVHDNTKAAAAPSTVLINHTTGEQTQFQNLERAEAYGQIYDLTSLQQPAVQLERLAVLSKLLFNRAPGLELLQSWQDVANEPSALVEWALASREAAPLAALSDAAFARLLVNHAFGNHPEALQFAESYLQQHDRAELVLLGIQHAEVIDAVATQYGLPLL